MLLSHPHPQPHAPRYHNEIIYPQLGMIFTSTPGMIHSHPQPHASLHNTVIHPQLGMILFHLALLSPALAPMMLYIYKYMLNVSLFVLSSTAQCPLGSLNVADPASLRCPDRGTRGQATTQQRLCVDTAYWSVDAVNRTKTKQ